MTIRDMRIMRLACIAMENAEKYANQTVNLLTSKHIHHAMNRSRHCRQRSMKLIGQLSPHYTNGPTATVCN